MKKKSSKGSAGKAGLALLAIAAVGTVGAVAFWPSSAQASPAPALPPKGPLYVPPAADTSAAESYEVQSGDSLSLIAREHWQDDADARADQAGIDEYDAAQLWLLLWSANYNGVPNPNLIHPGEKVLIPPLSTFSDQDIAKARRYYTNWRAYSR